MPPALLALATAAATIGGAALSSSAQRKAANQATQVSQQNNESNNALARDIYGQNRDLLSPFVQRGNEAGNAINALLGLGTGAPPPQPQPMQEGWSTNALMSGGFQSPYGADSGGEYFANGQPMSYPMQNAQFGQPQPAGAVTAPAPQGVGGYQDAFKNFLGSTGFQFQMDQGNKAINQGYAAKGQLQSGAALKALQDRGQQTALNNYFLPYMNLLGQRQGVGLSGASAVAGVGQNYAGTVIANNNNNSQTQLDAIAARAAAQSQLYGAAGNALGNVFGSSFNLGKARI